MDKSLFCNKRNKKIEIENYYRCPTRQVVTFNVFKVMNYPLTFNTCKNIDIVDELVVEIFEKSNPIESLKASLAQSKNI
jgi:hypothetical protein